MLQAGSTGLTIGVSHEEQIERILLRACQIDRQVPAREGAKERMAAAMMRGSNKFQEHESQRLTNQTCF